MTNPYQIQHYENTYIVTCLDPATHHWYVVARHCTLDDAVAYCKEEFEQQEDEDKQTLLDSKIREHTDEFSVRLLNCFFSAEIETIRDITNLRKQDILKFRNFGKKSYAELQDWLYQHGLSMKE